VPKLALEIDYHESVVTLVTIGLYGFIVSSRRLALFQIAWYMLYCVDRMFCLLKICICTHM